MDNLPVPSGEQPVAKTKQCVPAVPQSWGLPAILSDFTTSLDTGTERGRQLVEACLNGESLNGKEFINLEMSIVDFLMKPNESVDEETGVVNRYPQIFLIRDDGPPVRFSSNGVVKSLNVLCVTRRQAPWNPPLRVVVKVRDIGNGRQYYSLLPVDDPKKSKQKGQATPSPNA